MEQITVQPNQASVDGLMNALRASADVKIEQDRFFDAFLERAAGVRSPSVRHSTLNITTLRELTQSRLEFVRFPKVVETLSSYGMRICTDSECIALYMQTKVLAQYPSILCVMDPVIMPFDYSGPNSVDTPFCLSHHCGTDNLSQKKIGLHKVDGSLMLGLLSETTICVASA